jgi:hypothetical protein
MRFELPEAPGALKIRLEHGVIGGTQSVEVWVNGRLAGAYTADRKGTYTVDVPADMVTGKELDIRLHLPDAISPAELGTDESDTRILGLSMESMTIQKK